MRLCVCVFGLLSFTDTIEPNFCKNICAKRQFEVKGFIHIVSYDNTIIWNRTYILMQFHNYGLITSETLVGLSVTTAVITNRRPPGITDLLIYRREGVRAHSLYCHRLHLLAARTPRSPFQITC